MTGIYGRANNMVRSLGLICTGPDGTAIDLPPRGGAEGSAFRLTCPGRRAVVGFKVRAGGWLDAAGPICEGGARPKNVQPRAGETPAARPPATHPSAVQPAAPPSAAATSSAAELPASPSAAARTVPSLQQHPPQAVPAGIQAR
jgi:hypothetical protein